MCLVCSYDAKGNPRTSEAKTANYARLLVLSRLYAKDALTRHKFQEDILKGPGAFITSTNMMVRTGKSRLLFCTFMYIA
jgi:hypothetical protein